jgi:hypothetical protein
MKLLVTEEQFKKMNTTPYMDRWRKERFALKSYLLNFGQTMLSKENGKYYKVIYDSYISDLIGINYCVCIQYDTLTNETGDIIYVRAFDKFKPV